MNMTIGELVEWMIRLRDRGDFTWEEKDKLADAINLIDHNFERMVQVYDATEAGQYNRH